MTYQDIVFDLWEVPFIGYWCCSYCCAAEKNLISDLRKVRFGYWCRLHWESSIVPFFSAQQLALWICEKFGLGIGVACASTILFLFFQLSCSWSCQENPGIGAGSFYLFFFSPQLLALPRKSRVFDLRDVWFGYRHRRHREPLSFCSSFGEVRFGYRCCLHWKLPFFPADQLLTLPWKFGYLICKKFGSGIGVACVGSFYHSVPFFSAQFLMLPRKSGVWFARSSVRCRSRRLCWDF